MPGRSGYLAKCNQVWDTNVSKHDSILLVFLDLDWANPKTGGEKVNADVIRYAISNVPCAVIYTDANLPKQIHHNRYLRRIVHNLIILVRIVTTNCGTVITDHYLHPQFIFGAFAARVLRKRVVVIVHHLTAGLRTNRLLGWMEYLSESWLLRLATDIVVLSQSSQREVQSLGIEGSKITHITRPLQLTPDSEEISRKLAKLDEMQRPLRLLFVGTCYERKGIVYLIEALRLLQNEVERLDIVGTYDTNDPYYHNLQRIVQEAGKQSIVSFHGRLPDDTLLKFYLGADVFVLPSLWEGFGFVVQEAMAFALPIVASAVGGVLEQVSDGSEGILVPACDSLAIAGAITYLFDHPAERRRMGANGLNRSKENRAYLSFEEQLFARIS